MAAEKSINRRRNVDGVYRRKRTSDDFYAETDAKSRRFVGFWTLVIIILALVFIILVSLAISTRRATINPESLKAESESSENLVSFADRIGSIKSSGQTMLLFSAAELAKASGARESDFPLKNAKFVITKDNLYLVGRISGSLVFWPVKLKVKPEVADQKFHFTIAGDSLENIILPASDKEKIENTFERNFNQPLLDKNLIVSDVRLSDGHVEFYLVKGVK